MVIYTATDPDAKPDAWRLLQGTVVVPNGAGFVVELLGVSHQYAQQAAWFDDVELYRLRYLGDR